MNARSKILFLDALNAKGIELLKRQEALDIILKPKMGHGELLAEIDNYDGVVVRSSSEFTRDLIARATRLKVICRAGIGVDNIDVDAATKQGIVVMNCPEANTVTTAEHALSLIMALARNIPQAAQSMKEGKWEKNKFTGVELYNKTLGVIGLGRIGSILCKKAKALEMNVIGYDPYISIDAAAKIGVEPVDFDKLLGRSDFISLHVPRTPETRRMIGAEQFEKMKDGVRIINCARGGLIDEKQLYEAIRAGKVSGAALDVFEQEPPVGNPLLSLDQVICTPHLGAATSEAHEKVSLLVADQLMGFFLGGEIKNAVNLPQIQPYDMHKIKPHLDLAESLGSFLAQTVSGGISGIKVRYSSEIADMARKIVVAAALKGVLSPFMGQTVNLVNALILARERGIAVEETASQSSEDYQSLIEIEINTDKEKSSASGALLGKHQGRLVKFNDYPLIADLTGHMLVFLNQDRPGVIGKIGTLLGQNNINIGGMHLGRKLPLLQEVCILNLDTPITEDLLRQIRNIPEIIRAKRVMLTNNPTS